MSELSEILRKIGEKYPYGQEGKQLVRVVLFSDESGEVCRGFFDDSDYECLFDFHNIEEFVSHVKGWKNDPA